jgi:SAM-dependent methyltransferase
MPKFFDKFAGRGIYSGLAWRRARFVAPWQQVDSEQEGAPKKFIDENNLSPKLKLHGVCPVCSFPTVFSGFTDNLRESGGCLICRSTNRQRQMAFILKKALNLSASRKFKFPPEFRIYNVESNGALHARLKKGSNYTCSEYFGAEYSPGTVVEGVRHEDLQNLSFPDSSFDIILSSDVLEHMPRPYQAHREIFRTLKPGGRHIFTVPFDPSREKDDIRATIVDGDIVYLAEKLFHGDPVRPEEGILVWTIFGTEMMSKLERIGYTTSAQDIYAPKLGIVGNGNLVFEARKPQ